MNEPLARLAAALADRYRLERELGAGGMATVYLAADLKHDRQVAIKVLKPELAAVLGAERFVQEIKTTAALSHPHILPLFDSGEAGGFLYYVMPYIEGETIREKLNRETQLGIEEAVRIASAVADALDYAHRRGVIHRDIKPENILLHDGRPMVMDFGIALAVSAAAGGRMTETGLSLGTPHYMSPEQATADKQITARSDIYSLASVLYEMLTGNPPHVGSSAQQIIMRIIADTVRPVTEQRRNVPPNVAAALAQALEKLPADRFASAAEFAQALGRSDFALPVTHALGAPRALAGRRAGQLAPWVVAAAALGWTAWLTTQSGLPTPPPTAAFDVSFGPGSAFQNVGGSSLAFAPDGSRIAYMGSDSAGTSQLFVRALDRVDPLPVPGTRNASQPFFSPDGEWLGFLQDGKIRKVALAGGAVVTICEAGAARGLSWGADDIIVWSRNGNLSRVSAGGGQPVDILVADSGQSLRGPDLLPGGRAVVFTRFTPTGSSLWAAALDGGRVTPLDQSGLSPRWVESGFLAYAEQDGTLFARAFDARNLRFTGPAQPIVGGVQIGNWGAGVAVARTGAIVFTGAELSTTTDLVLADRDGRITSIPAPRERYSEPRFSPDGRRISVTVAARQGGLARRSYRSVSDIWIWDLGAGNMQRITFDSASSAAEWLPDGRRLVYARASGPVVGLFTILTDGSGKPESLLTRPNPIFESSPTPDGRALVFREMVAADGSNNRDIWITGLDSTQGARPLAATPFEERNPAVSPDGRWLAYTSNETGEYEVYVRGLAEGSGRTRVSTGNGGEPRWAHSGRELFFIGRDSVYAVTVTPGPELRFGTPRGLLPTMSSGGLLTGWDVSPDDRRFVFARPPETTQGDPLRVILHWFDRLRAARR